MEVKTLETNPIRPVPSRDVRESCTSERLLARPRGAFRTVPGRLGGDVVNKGGIGTFSC
jgi:hypothetical protein